MSNLMGWHVAAACSGLCIMLRGTDESVMMCPGEWFGSTGVPINRPGSCLLYALLLTMLLRASETKRGCVEICEQGHL